ncbi:MAG: hypothetical protein BGO96_13395 [Micrococcales bacterium 73-15]|nr:MAG: hypothetical protein BGO96_13395 [Micrococcales bacterium 73-15]
MPGPRPPALPEPLALNRASIDRAGIERTAPGTLEAALADPATRVVLVDGARVAILREPDGDGVGAPRLALVGPAARRGEGETFYLGRDDAGAYVAWSCDLDEALPGAPTVSPAASPGARDRAPGGVTIASLRDVGHLLDDRDTGLATAAVALSQWRRTHRHCPRCGARTRLVEGGWAARCDVDGHVVYPRTDPAVIMAVHDGTGRILLARSVAWPERRRSVLAGFVEAGEAPEAAVRREVAEEVGLEIGRVAYAGAQPWPFPASLMLGFHAWVAGAPGDERVVDRVDVPDPAPDGIEITHADWFTREELAAELADGSVRLPMRTSIALALVESWYGRELPAG